MSHRRRHRSVFKPKAAVLGSTPKSLLLFPEGAPVRILKAPFPFRRGKFKGYVSHVEADAFGGVTWVRVVLTSAPVGARSYLGKPFHLKPSRLKLLPSRMLR